MPAPKGNRYAAKPEAERFTESLFVRMTAAEKKICLESSGDDSVSGWARKTLLETARREQVAGHQDLTRSETETP